VTKASETRSEVERFVVRTVKRLKDLLNRGETVCLVTAIQSGRPEFPPGAKVLFLRDGSREGALPPGELAERLSCMAKEALVRKKKGLAEFASGFRV
jgi:hypothetical protein